MIRREKKEKEEESTWVGKPDIAFGIYKEIVDGVEIPAKVIVQKRSRLIGVRVQCSNASSLLGPSNRIVAS